jgi:glucuronate isomerase
VGWREITMNGFMDENYLLDTEIARKLYFEYAKDMPIFDYHCHLPAQEIAEDKRFKNITEIWLNGDHYKWRVMRANGAAEDFITGNKSDREKFQKWAETVPYLLGNPLYQWTHLELKRYFGIDGVFSPKNADEIWEKCNSLLAQEEFSARNLIKKSNVKALCTTDDPVDTLAFHQTIKEDNSFDVKVLPTFRPDMALEISHEKFLDWMNQLSDAAGMRIETLDDYQEALKRRIDDFHQMGCRLSDLGVSAKIHMDAKESEIRAIFKKKFDRSSISVEEQTKFRSAVLMFLAREYAKHGWAMQLHIGGLRNTNSRMFRSLGANTGFDSMADFHFAEDLAGFMDSLERSGSLPKTILYCLNPKDNYMLATMAGNFQGGVPGKIQFGSAWWFNDHLDGMMEQMKTIANVGLFARFVGMLTDSRSFLSYPRHEYFRRIMCQLIGSWVERGDYPKDFDILGQIVKDVCFHNIKNYLDIEL